ncbi:hypothetical protein [Peribacillus cavernae]|uniref:hypothetical protein n=1 Tax=Peribacillus cavernae TaxID=1674310 RepID=UPI0026BB15E0|nr:hypothetical protein [Peribacillus cavernae]MDQ0217901.1 hypothetical protein [Peribacillus cavernae]
MEDERIRIFDDNRRPIGVATREEVHKLDTGMKHFIAGLSVKKRMSTTFIFKFAVRKKRIIQTF